MYYKKFSTITTGIFKRLQRNPEFPSKPITELCRIKATEISTNTIPANCFINDYWQMQLLGRRKKMVGIVVKLNIT